MRKMKNQEELYDGLQQVVIDMDEEKAVELAC